MVIHLFIQDNADMPGRLRVIERRIIHCEGSAIQNGTALLLISLTARIHDRVAEAKVVINVERSKQNHRSFNNF